MKTLKLKPMAYLLVAIVASVGVYNAFVLNTVSEISSKDAAAVRRLDETYGVVKFGRSLATESKWTRLRGPAVAKAFKKKNSLSYEAINNTESAIAEGLNLSISEMTDGKGNPLNSSGQLFTRNGSIESLEVSLPDGGTLSVAYAEMSGNVFEYEHEGQILSGLMYQVDQSSYMVTLSNGPLEGYRLRFTDTKNPEDAENEIQALAEIHNVQAGTFGI